MVRNPLTAEQIEAGQRLGTQLRLARQKRTLDEVASQAGISPETLRKIETGRLPTPAFGTVVSVCAVLGLDLSIAADAWLGTASMRSAS